MGVSAPQRREAPGPPWVSRRGILRQGRECRRQAIRVQINFCQGASRPGVGTQLRCPLAVEPGGRRSLVNGMTVLVSDDGHDGSVAIAVIQGREELWRIYNFRVAAR